VGVTTSAPFERTVSAAADLGRIRLVVGDDELEHASVDAARCVDLGHLPADAGEKRAVVELVAARLGDGGAEDDRRLGGARVRRRSGGGAHDQDGQREHEPGGGRP